MSTLQKHSLTCTNTTVRKPVVMRICPKSHGVHREIYSASKSIILFAVLIQYSTAVGAISTCQSCPANSVSPAGSKEQADCKCGAGSAGSAGSCTTCVAGKYKIASGDGACMLCLADQYSTAVGAISNTCQPCPANSVSPAGSNEQTDCKCGAGSTGSAGSCTACVAGKYKIASGDGACMHCLAGQYATAVGATSNVCQSCPSNSDAAEASGSAAACICNAGFLGVRGELCTQCPVGTYRATR